MEPIVITTERYSILYRDTGVLCSIVDTTGRTFMCLVPLYTYTVRESRSIGKVLTFVRTVVKATFGSKMDVNESDNIHRHFP